MSYHGRIKTLEEAYRITTQKISNHEGDKESLNVLKEQQTKYFDELRRLRKLQWEEDHERVNFDDER
jgi:hypothetical protein